MPETKFRTHVAKAPAQARKSWHIADASGATLGRPDYSPNLDLGDFVVVVNAEKISVTGRKLEQKQYYRHSGYPGGLRQQNLQTLLAEHPDRVIISAVKGMLPRNKIGRRSLKRLHVYAGPNHPHGAQNPQEI